jgi:hypothetical protein
VTPAGYSGTPLPKKLGIKPESVVALIGAPDGFAAALAGATITSKPKGAQRIILFVRTLEDLARRWKTAAAAADEDTTIWIAWPKRSSGVETDLSENAVRAHCLPGSWVDYKVCAIDQTWSALAFARRKTPAVAASK